MLNDKTKTAFAAAIVISLLAFAYAVVSYVHTYSRTAAPGSFRSFTVSGEGKVVAVPDIAQFTFTVITEGAEIGDLLKENTEKINAAIGFLKENGVADKDIKTQAYSLSPQYEQIYCPPPRYGNSLEGTSGYPAPYRSPVTCPPPRIAGYTITQSVSVKVRDFEKLGILLSGVVEYGANSVSGVSFSIDDPGELQNQARREAIEKAKAKADAIAKAGGFGVGKLLSIDEGYSPYRYFAQSLDYFGGKGGEGESLPAPVIEPGSQEVVVNVTLRYEIE